MNLRVDVPQVKQSVNYTMFRSALHHCLGIRRDQRVSEGIGTLCCLQFVGSFSAIAMSRGPGCKISAMDRLWVSRRNVAQHLEGPENKSGVGARFGGSRTYSTKFECP